MNRNDVAFLFGLAGFLMGGAGVFVALRAQSTADEVAAHLAEDREVTDDVLGGLGARVDTIDGKLDSMTRRLSAMKDEQQAVLERVDRVARHVAAQQEGRPAGESALPTGPEAGDPAVTASARLEFDALREKVFSGTATDEEQQQFWEMSREKPELLKAMIADLESAVGDRPNDLAARMALGNAYIAKLFTVPFGPEQGVWGGKAEKQWKEVLERDADHWQARFSLAFGYSQYPDFMNKTPDAIREFETLRQVQERSTTAPGHAQTYFQLSLLYRKQGQAEKAREVLDEGLRRFPNDANLKKALEGAGGPGK